MMSDDFDWDAAVKDQKNWTLMKFTVTSPLWREKRCPFSMVIQGQECFCRFRFGHSRDHEP